ncbi:MAG: hypothetical protein GEU28_09390 [Dehalococcoidia bacterium]|nr:hypothetical protein [Dehalococcoidia bacterium]
MNPSTASIVEAIEAAPTDLVVVLPDNKNIIMAARQAATLSEKDVQVVETTSVPQGIAALLALSQDQEFADNIRAMNAALHGVRSGEVTRAVRDLRLGDVDIRAGNYMAIVDGDLVAAAGAIEEAVTRALSMMTGPDSALIALYPGRDVDDASASSLTAAVREAWPDHEVEVVRGNQPYYEYFISVE